MSRHPSSPRGIEEFWKEVDRIEKEPYVDPNFGWGGLTVPYNEPHKENFSIPFKASNVPHRVIPTDQLPQFDGTYHGPINPSARKEHLGTVKPPPKDNVNLPHHYARYKIEPIQFLMENKVDAFQFNIIKYVLRHDAKNGLEDIRKVLRYGEMYLKYLSGDPDWWKPSTMTIGGYER